MISVKACVPLQIVFAMAEGINTIYRLARNGQVPPGVSQMSQAPDLGVVLC